MKKISLILIVFTVLISTNALAFDGERKGFVIGGGWGPAIQSLDHTYFDNTRKTDVGIGISFLFGYSWNEKNMIVWQRDGIITWTDSSSHMRSLGGICYNHYFGSVGKSLYVSIGAHPSNDYFISTGGFGYEFIEHFQISTRFWHYNETKDYHIYITLSAIAF